MSIRLNRNVKYICYVIELFFFYILQCTPNLFPKIFTATPILLLPAVITMALLESEIVAIILGAIAGLFVDLAFGNYFGLFAIIMAIICCLISLSLRKRVRVHLLNVSLIGAVSLFICILCDWFFRYYLQGYSQVLIIFINNYLPIYIYSLLCLPAIYILNFGIYQGLKVIDD